MLLVILWKHFFFSQKIIFHREKAKSPPNLYLTEVEISNIDRLCKEPKVSETVYKELAHIACEIPMECWLNWVNYLEAELSELDWLDCIPRFINCTTSTRLQNLGIQFIIRDVLTNNRLVHIRKADTNMCYICRSEIETIIHLYWACPKNRQLWTSKIIYTKIPLGPLELLFGIWERVPEEGPPEK